MIHFPILWGNEASEGALPCRGAFGCEDEGVVCPTTSWHRPRKSRKVLILRPGEVWGLSPLGRGRLTCDRNRNPNVRVFLTFMAPKIKKLKNPITNSVASIKKHKCIGNPDAFCYICGKYKPKKCRKTITEKIKKLYEECFELVVSHQDTNWAPHIVCSACYNMLCRWKIKIKTNFNFPFQHYGRSRQIKMTVISAWQM